MTGFDIIVLLIVGIGAIGGFVRGFVQEVLSLLAWAVSVLAIRFFHSEVSEALIDVVGSLTNASILAYALLLIVPFAIMKLIAKWAGQASRKSVLGPIDRMLGFGFGMIKGVVIVVVAFSLIVLVYDTIWASAGRPTWISEARTYQFVDAASKAMVETIAEQRAKISDRADL